MIKSMTGFGRGEYSDGKRSVTVEMRSVNHRYCDISVRLPRKYGFAEEFLRSAVKERLRRGRAEINVTVDSVAAEDYGIRLNLAAADQYFANLRTLMDHFGLKGDVNLELLAGMPDVISHLPGIENEDEILLSFGSAARGALEQFDQMRLAEGEKLAEDIISRARLISELASKIEALAPEAARAWAEKLRERITELAGRQAELPEDRIALEAAIFADKASVTEELVRLKSHVSQMERIIRDEEGANGKKLDFLTQELNREANTIGSKANDLRITSVMLEIKSEAEKIREQVQNIE